MLLDGGAWRERRKRAKNCEKSLKNGAAETPSPSAFGGLPAKVFELCQLPQLCRLKNFENFAHRPLLTTFVATSP